MNWMYKNCNYFIIATLMEELSIKLFLFNPSFSKKTLWIGNSLKDSLWVLISYRYNTLYGKGWLHTEIYKKKFETSLHKKLTTCNILQHFFKTVCVISIISESWGSSLETVWRWSQRDPCCPFQEAMSIPLVQKPGYNHRIHQSLLTPLAPCWS